MRAARLALVLLLAFGSSQAAKLPGHNHNHGTQSSANSGNGGVYWWQNNDFFGGGGGSRPTTPASGNANAHTGVGASGSSSNVVSSGGEGSYGGGSYGGGGSQQSGNLQNATNPSQITVQQPQQGSNPNVFTPTQSPHCARGQDCVRWQLCEQGVIFLTGKNIPRQQPVPQGMRAKQCGILGNICCAIPAKIIATQQQLGHQNQVQTPPNQNQQSFPSSQNQQNVQQPSQQQFPNQASFPQTINNNNIQQDFPKRPSFSRCSASLFCIHQSKCNLYNGFIEPQIEQWPGQQFVQISMCTSDTQPEGVCCQEPHPQIDPWTEQPELDQQSSGSQQQTSNSKL